MSQETALSTPSLASSRGSARGVACARSDGRGDDAELAAAGAGHSGHGLTLDGKSYLGNGDKAVPAGVPIGNEAYTVCAWIKPKQPVGMMGVVGWGDWGRGAALSPQFNPI